MASEQRVEIPSPALLEEIRAVVRWWKSSGRSSGGFTPQATDMLFTPETYMALAPTGGIPAISQETGTGSPDVLGSAECDIYRVTSDGRLETYELRKEVFNFFESDILEGTWVLVTRDKGGVWLAAASSVGDTNAIYIAKAPSDAGLGSATTYCHTGTGTGTTDVAPTAVACDIYKVEGGLIVPVEGLSKEVYNLGPMDIPACALFRVVRDTYGSWIAQWFEEVGGTPGLIGHSVDNGQPNEIGGPSVGVTTFDFTDVATHPNTGLMGSEDPILTGLVHIWNARCGLNQWGVLDDDNWQIIPASKVVNGDFHVINGLVAAYDNTDTSQRRIRLEPNIGLIATHYTGTTKYISLDSVLAKLNLYTSSTEGMVIQGGSTPTITAYSGTSGSGPTQRTNFIEFGQDSIIIEVGSEDGDFQLQLLAGGDGTTSVCALSNAAAGGSAFKIGAAVGVTSSGIANDFGLTFTGGILTGEGSPGDAAAVRTSLGLGGLAVQDAGTAVADATGAGDVVAQLNALLASLRANGVIAT